MKELFRKFWKFFFERKPKTYKIRFVEDLPNVIKKRTIYLIDDWAISFKCPCGCLADIHLNSIKTTFPSWKYKVNKKNQISLYPSIRRITGCKSHFWIINGNIEMVS